MNEFDNAVYITRKLEKTSSTLEKETILKAAAGNEVFKAIMKFIFDPYVRTGIAEAKFNKEIEPAEEVIDWKAYIDYVKTHQTGSDTDIAIAKSFVYNQEYLRSGWLALAMVTKNLKIGVTATTLNKVYGKTFIPTLGIMRAQHYKDVKDKVSGPFIVTEKLDGARRILIKENGKVTMYTRAGHVDSGLVDIEFEADLLPDNSVFDGELLAIGDFKDAIALRQATNAIANSSGERHGLTFNVFDMLPVSDYKLGKSTHTAIVRKATVANLFNCPSIAILTNQAFVPNMSTFKYIKAVPVLGIVNTWEEIMEITQPIWDRHFEGTMLNDVAGKYQVKNTPCRQILKVKATEEFKLKCVGVLEGQNENRGKMGKIELDYKGHIVRCGSGFNAPQRVHYWEHPEQIIGQWIEGDSFGETSNKAGGISLNCPIFKRIAGDSE